jgi:hypothetical protein
MIGGTRLWPIAILVGLGSTGLGWTVSSALAVGHSDTDLNNAARRMTSLSDLMERSHRRLLRDWVSGMSFATTGRAYVEKFNGLSLDNGEPAGSLDFVRTYYDFKLFLADSKKRWSLGGTAAQLSYGHSRTSAFEGPGIEREAIGAQYVDAAYLMHGNVGPVWFKGGYLSSKMNNGGPSEVVGGGEVETHSEWVAGQVEVHGIFASMRRSLRGKKSLDHLQLDLHLVPILNMVTDMTHEGIPYVSLLSEYTQFRNVSQGVLAAYEAQAAGPQKGLARGDDFLAGLSVEQSFVPFLGKYFGRPFSLNFEGYYGLKSHHLRDVTVQLVMSGWRMKRKWRKGRFSATSGWSLGYSKFWDPVALPALGRSESIEGFQGGYLGTVWLPMARGKNAGMLGLDFEFMYRKNWAHDLKRVVEYVDVDMWYFGFGLSFGV